jgi:two-component system, OmpR family, heavy metal sensor histidine kinase CusS
VSLPGRPEGEHRRAQPEVTPVSTPLPLVSASSYSIGRRLSWQLAIQTALGLSLLCACIWGAAYGLFDRQQQQRWDAQAGLVNELLRVSSKKGEAYLVEKLETYAPRRPGSYLVVARADGSELYRDAERTFTTTDSGRAGSFDVTVPALTGGVVRATLTLDAANDRKMLAALAALLLGAALTGGAFVGWAASWRVRRGLAPLLELAAQTRAIDANRLGQRLSLKQPVDELQPAVDQFNALMSRLERAYLQLEAFNADVAHEMRTPLAALIGHTELALSRHRSAESLRETLASNLEDLQYVAAMVNDMLFLAGADRGVEARRGQPVSLAALARQVVDFHEAALEAAELQVRVEGEALVAVDEPLIKRALSNLVSNATRYAERGSVVRLQIQAGGPGPVRIEVENQGPMIAADLVARIFDRFVRADSARTHSEALHHGLGLAIVAAIARMHGGQPMARSKDGFTRVGFTVGHAEPPQHAGGPAGATVAAIGAEPPGKVSVQL